MEQQSKQIIQINQQEDHWFLNDKKVIKRQMLSKASQQIINGVSIVLESSFGCLQSPIRRNSYFVSDDVMMFLSGKHVVLYDIIRRRQSYIMKSAEDEQVQAFNFLVTTRQTLLIAMAFKSTSKILPTVKVYNRKKQRFYQLVHSHLLPNSSVFEITFINNGKNLVTLTKGEDGYGLTIFQVSKEITVCFQTIKNEIKFLESLGSTVFLIGGPKFLTLYFFTYELNQLDEETNYFELIPQNTLTPGEHIIDCALLDYDQYVICATNQNNFIVFKGKTFKYKCECPIEDPMELKPLLGNKNQPTKKQKQKPNILKPKVSALTKTAKGFVVGMIGRPILEVFEFSNTDEIVFKGSYCIKDENIYGLHQVHLASDEMYAALTVVYFNKSAYSVARNQQDDVKMIENTETLSCEEIIDNYQGKIELFTFNLAIVEALNTVQKDPFEPLFEKGVHRGNIQNISITPMRSILASVCEDKTIKFWDYSNEFKELFSHYFHETPNCVALHPLSFQCAIGFKEGMKIYYVLDDDLKLVYTENMKSCTAIAYSEGGHLLAASNFTTVIVFNPQKFFQLYTFPNHQANLKELYFTERDSQLVTICQLGVLYVWNLNVSERFGADRAQTERAVEHAQKANKYNCVTYCSYYDLVIGACSDLRIRVYSKKGQNIEMEYDCSPTVFTAMCISLHQNAIFFGTSQGSIRIYAYPFYHFNPKTMEYIEIPVHQLAVTQIKVSPDNNFLITASSDGSIFFSKIKQFQNGQELTQLDLLAQGEIGGKFTNTFALNPLSLSSKITQELRKDQIKELDFRLQNFKSDIDDERERLIGTYNLTIKELEDKNNQQLTQLREQLSSTIQVSDAKYSDLKMKMHNLRSDMKKIQSDLEDEQSKKLLSLYEERDGLQEQLNSIKEKQRIQKEQALKEYQSSLQQVDEEYLHKYQELYQRFSEAMQNMKLDQKKFKEVLQQGEKEYETFYKTSQQKLQEELFNENTRTEELRSQISKFTKENERLTHRKDFLDGLLKDTQNQVTNLQNELLNYQDKHKNMIQQLSEKEDLINQREQQIKDFRMKNVHLQNFQKVYDYRVNTLKEEREPLLEHLKNMDKHVKNLYNELIEEAGLKQQYEQEKDANNTKILELKSKLAKAMKGASISKRRLDVYKYEITQILSTETDQWMPELIKLYKQLEQENKKNLLLKESVFNETMQDMKKDPIQEAIDRNTQDNIQKELSSQKGFLKKKLTTVQGSVKKSLEDRHQTYYSIQSTNTLLINECNKLRDKKQRLREHIDKQTKAFREIKRELHSHGIEINIESDQDKEESSVDEEEIIKFGEQQKLTFVTNQKTPFAQYEEQRLKQKLVGSEQVLRKQQTSTSSKRLYADLCQEVRKNVDEQKLHDKFRQKASNYFKQNDSQIVLPTVHTQQQKQKPQINVPPPPQTQQNQPPETRSQLLSAGFTLTRTSKQSTNTNFFLQTTTSNFTQKTPHQFGKQRQQKQQKQQK